MSVEKKSRENTPVWIVRLEVGRQISSLQADLTSEHPEPKKYQTLIFQNLFYFSETNFQINRYLFYFWKIYTCLRVNPERAWPPAPIKISPSWNWPDSQAGCIGKTFLTRIKFVKGAGAENQIKLGLIYFNL